MKVDNLTGGRPEYLGVADGVNPISIPASAFRLPDYEFEFKLEHPNFKFADDWAIAQLRHIPKRSANNSSPTEIISSHYPIEETPLRAPPKSAIVGVLYYFKENPLITVPFLTLFVAGGVVWTRARKNKTYELKRQSLVAHSDLTDPLMNTTLGPYLIVARLGQGGMATVYKGVPSDTLDPKDQVAIKVVKKEFAENDEFRERFKREVLLSKDLSHPNIIRVDDWGEQEGLLYMVLEYVDGQTLDDMIPRGGWSLEEAAPYILPILSGLITAHERDIVHRDLKPENIMVTKSGQVKIMDFGLARTNRVSSKLTKTGSAMGTPAYISPEQIRGITPIPAMDQYSLGVMMYEIFTGRLPFDEEGLEAVMLAHFSKQPPSPAEWKPNLHPVLCQMILRMLEKNSAVRFESLTVVKEGLEHLQAHGDWELPSSPGPRETAPPSQPRRVTKPTTDQPSENADTVGFPSGQDEGTIGFQTREKPHSQE